MSLFDNGNPEGVLLFVCNFNTTLVVSGTMEAGAEYQYLCNLVHREALRHFEPLPAEVESMKTLNVDDIIK